MVIKDYSEVEFTAAYFEGNLRNSRLHSRGFVAELSVIGLQAVI